MRNLPPSAAALVVARQKAELEIVRDVPPPLPAIIRPPEPPAPPLSESRQPARRLLGEDMPAESGVSVWSEKPKEHQWGGTGKIAGETEENYRKRTACAPAWLNGGDMHNPGSGMVCACCGVELVSGGPSLKKGAPKVVGWIQADQAGMEYVYRDAGGLLITSFEPLPCPIFIGNKPGNIGGSIMDNRVKIRDVTGKVYNVTYRVEGLEERMDRLELENQALREALSQPIDASAVVEFLASMVAAAARAKMDSVPVMIEGTQYALPEPVARVIIDVAAQPERETVLVNREVKQEKEDKRTFEDS